MSIVDTNYTRFFIGGKKYEIDFTDLVCKYKEYPFADVAPEDRAKWMETARQREIKIYYSDGVFIKTSQELESDFWHQDFAAIQGNADSLKTEILTREEAIKMLDSHGNSVIEENYHKVFPDYNNSND